MSKSNTENKEKRTYNYLHADAKKIKWKYKLK